MKTITRYILLLVGLFYTLTCLAQYDPDKVCRIDNGELIFSLNLKWTDKEKAAVSKQFDLDSTLVAQVYQGKSVIIVNGETWNAKKVKPDLVELSKPIQSSNEKSLKIDDLFLEIDDWMNFTGKTVESSVSWGVNNFKLSYVFVYNQKTARFYLPASTTAHKAYIAGDFNGWSTTQTPMERVSDGWMVYVDLKPGKYSYKFIIDGEWTTDPNNKLRERDGEGDYNSVVYCCNHRFELNGYKDARNVVVTGNFFGWNPKGIAMNKTSDGWSLPVYLRDGTYAYKFLVDNQWITDPANKEVRKDADGNLNSFVEIGKPYIFKLDGFTTADKVILSGSFNGWSQNELVMDKTEKGWQLPYVVSAGNYEYKFIVDGEWMTDPANPFTTGSGNMVNSFIALKANYIFKLDQYPDAETVIVTGSFNNWSEDGYRMTRRGGKWILPIYLQPGKYTYKFIVDGNWIIDPFNKLYEQNEHGTDNSVLWIDPF